MRIALVYTGSFHGGGVERLVWECARHFGAWHEVTAWSDAAPASLAHLARPLVLSHTEGLLERLSGMPGSRDKEPVEIGRRSSGLQ